MSSTVPDSPVSSPGSPELTPLGKRLEIMRVERGVSKQRLARRAGTSRQQLWRLMTGRAELTPSLRERLALALGVDPSQLSGQVASAPDHASHTLAGAPATTPTSSEFLSDTSWLTATLRTLPAGDEGRRLKRALLDAVEDLATEAGRALPADFAEIRRGVLGGEV